jgi:hypothetical protein
MSRLSSLFKRKSTTTAATLVKEHRKAHLQPTIAQGLQVILDSLRTGDIVLLATSLNSGVFGSNEAHLWTGVGLVVRIQEAQREHYPSDYWGPNGELPDTTLALLEADPKAGKVQLFPLEQRLAKIVNSIHDLALRRCLGGELGAESRAALEKFIVASALSRKFKPSLWSKACGWWCCCAPERRQEFFRSELIHDALQTLGVIARPQQELDVHHLLLSSFDSAQKHDAMSLDKLCVDGRSFGKEEMLISGGTSRGDLIPDLKELKRVMAEKASGRV